MEHMDREVETHKAKLAKLAPIIRSLHDYYTLNHIDLRQSCEFILRTVYGYEEDDLKKVMMVDLIKRIEKCMKQNPSAVSKCVYFKSSPSVLQRLVASICIIYANGYTTLEDCALSILTELGCTRKEMDTCEGDPVEYMRKIHAYVQLLTRKATPTRELFERLISLNLDDMMSQFEARDLSVHILARCGWSGITNNTVETMIEDIRKIVR
jgi:hypothetical protein